MMNEFILFPYFYFANEVLLRHQLLYATRVFRVHPSDRPPRDSKGVKPFIKKMEENAFLENLVLHEKDDWISQRFVTTLERAYRENLDEYIQCMGKYGKERASTKTFHLCRIKTWPELTQFAMELGTAVKDHYDEWCFATRQMVLTLTTCHALQRQREKQQLRCTDALEFDELAVLLETLPSGLQSDKKITRAVLEFPYMVPKGHDTATLDELQSWREALLPRMDPFWEALLECVQELNQLKDSTSMSSKLQSFHQILSSQQQEIKQIIKDQGDSSQTFYMHYRWYPPQESVLSNRGIKPLTVCKDVALGIEPRRAGEGEIDSLYDSPGCLIAALEQPVYERGFGQKISRFFQKFSP